ncbi:hypothetical protein E2C01_092965 [Portunus trituberculatus]|uniref:Uncharacterized protein n=1 Tax=Portunus trituberculatus TaxID=210409 RepID=A0A5B7JHV0_PORTR|nr:hypothetical protein [Portunus trituberculatus]
MPTTYSAIQDLGPDDSLEEHLVVVPDITRRPARHGVQHRGQVSCASLSRSSPHTCQRNGTQINIFKSKRTSVLAG